MTLFGFERLVGVLTIVTLVYAVSMASPQVRDYLRGVSSAGLGLLISGGATLGSLALSEGFGLIPCELCWFQRIFMYPLPVLIAVGLIARSSEVWRYVVTLASIGAAFSVYHLLVQWTPASSTCALDASCTVRLMEFLGFVSIPAMALTAFVGTILSMYYWRAT